MDEILFKGRKAIREVAFEVLRMIGNLKKINEG